MADNPVCAIHDCDKPSDRRGYCTSHYWRLWKHGDPLGGKKRFVGEAKNFLEAAFEHKGDDCVHWPFHKTKMGYPTVYYDGRTQLAHRLVCAQIHGAPSAPNLQAAHNCGVRLCVNPRHLRWATAKENQADRISHGTLVRGERNTVSKLREKDVKKIRRLVANGETKASVAIKFGVRPSTIGAVVSGKTWGWLS